MGSQTSGSVSVFFQNRHHCLLLTYILGSLCWEYFVLMINDTESLFSWRQLKTELSNPGILFKRKSRIQRLRGLDPSIQERMPLIMIARQGSMRKDKDLSAKGRDSEDNTGEISAEGRCIVIQKKQSQILSLQWRDGIIGVRSGEQARVMLCRALSAISFWIFLKHYPYTWKDFYRRLKLIGFEFKITPSV